MRREDDERFILGFRVGMVLSMMVSAGVAFVVARPGGLTRPWYALPLTFLVVAAIMLVVVVVTARGDDG